MLGSRSLGPAVFFHDRPTDVVEALCGALPRPSCPAGASPQLWGSGLNGQLSLDTRENSQLVLLKEETPSVTSMEKSRHIIPAIGIMLLNIMMSALDGSQSPQ